MLIDTKVKRNICDNYICEPDSVVNDFVYLSQTEENKVLVATDNNSPSPIIGFIKSKYSDVKACVYYIGRIDNYSDLLEGKKVFIGNDGLPTTSVPKSGYIQTIGISLSTEEFLFNPNLNRVLRS